MFKKLCAVLLSIVATGYVVYYSFWAMNQPSDGLYVGGMFAILFWFGFVTYCWKKILKERKNESKNASGGSDSSSNNSAVGMHN